MFFLNTVFHVLVTYYQNLAPISFFRPETDASLTTMLYHLCLKNRKTRQTVLVDVDSFSATGRYSPLIISFDCFFLLIILNFQTNLKP